ncbi:MAG: undecaprenyl-diphosphate phosphatase [Candidatus Dadabacteria bacterium]|nr:MAG: undecaprenyl-diphosphate phosphatase [Candidatus Dadabacteria bacterium]
MTVWDGLVLGLVQGLTEFLPVSSSGHLVIVQSLVPGFAQPGILFDVLLHAATLGAVLLYFWRDVAGMAASLLPGGDPGHRRLVGWIVAGTVPTGILGVAFKDPLEALFHAPRAAAAMLLVTGALLWVSEVLARGRDPMDRIGVGRALAVGTVQGLAIVPGISRSGSTIAAGSLLGVRTADAARFSFLLSIPAIVGAVVLEVRHLAHPAIAWGPYLAGVVAAFASGLAAIHWLLRVIRRGRFRWFAVYCWLLGAGYLLLGP